AFRLAGQPADHSRGGHFARRCRGADDRAGRRAQHQTSGADGPRRQRVSTSRNRKRKAMNRRDFLSSRRLVDAACQVLAVADEAAPIADFLVQDEPAVRSDTLLFRASRRAMATDFEIALPFATPDALPAAEAALDLIDALEQQLTVYRDDS